MIQFWKVTASTLGTAARTVTVQMRGGGAEGDDDATEQGADPTDPASNARTESYDAAEVIQPLGLMARPYITARTEALAIELGDEVIALGLVDKSVGCGATTVFSDLEEGETRMYGAKEGAARVRIRPTGSLNLECLAGQSISITHPSASIVINASGVIAITSAGGQDITLNGGSLKVARVSDGVKVASITAVAGPYPVTWTTSLMDADGALGAPTVGATCTLTGKIANADGAARAKA